MAHDPKYTLPPGSSLGILGNGQLGRMTAQAATKLGYKTAVLGESAQSPAGQVCDRDVVGSTADPETVAKFGSSVDRLTLEFENIAADAARAAEKSCLLCPAAHILHTTQNRVREKSFLNNAGLRTTQWRHVRTYLELEAAVHALGMPSVVKTADFGYDGKGQYKIENEGDTKKVPFPGNYVLEKWVSFTKELSVIGARSLSGEIKCFPLFENSHKNHILDYTVSPAAVPHETESEAERLMTQLLEHLKYVGVLCAELFLTSEGQLLINELAPRPHNSGHLTIEGNKTSQFEQHVRAVANLPLGNTNTIKPAAMVNLLGDLWENGEPNWAALSAFPGVKLHLYGKKEARAGRKMGHLTLLAEDTASALATLIRARDTI